MNAKRMVCTLLAVLLCATICAGCGGVPAAEAPAPVAEAPAPAVQTQSPAATEAPAAEPTGLEITGQVFDLFDYLWVLPMDGTDEEFSKYAVRNFKFVQSIEPMVTEDTYFELYGASARIRQKREGAREEFVRALGKLELKCSVANGVYFLWNKDNVPMLDGESFTEEELDNGPLDGYGFIPLLIKCLLDDPTAAKGNLIVCSGGGMSNRSNGGEAYPAIRVFNELGYNVFVLQRRIRPFCDEDIFMDQQRAIRLVRYYAEKEGWGGQDMIAACGWSGGATTLMGAVNHLFGDRNPTYYDSDYVPDEIDAINSDLDVALPIYGGMLDDNGENTNLPAFYMCVGTEDNTGEAERTPAMYDAVIARGVDARIDIYEGAGHGFGVGQEDRRAATPECATWPGYADEFMQAHRGYSQK